MTAQSGLGGGNDSGEVGDGTTTQRLSPVQVTALQPLIIGTIAINGGAAFSTSANVTLSLWASDSIGVVTQMCFSNDAANWSAWEPYQPTQNWTLTTGDGSKTVYVMFEDQFDNTSAFSASILLDTGAPVISLVTASPSMVAAGDLVNVSVTATPSATVSTVTANGVSLTNSGAGVWSGNIPAASVLGRHPATVTVTDVASNIAIDSSASYLTTTVYGANCDATSSPVTATVTANHLFKLCGPGAHYQFRQLRDQRWIGCSDRGHRPRLRWNCRGRLCKRAGDS